MVLKRRFEHVRTTNIPEHVIRRLEKELEQRRGEIERIEKKLANEGFVSKAPENVVQRERKRLATTQTERDNLESRLAGMRE